MKATKISSKNGFRSLFVSLAFVLFYHGTSAQNKVVGLNPTMTISNFDRNTENPMQLEKLKIDIKVIGQVAVTTLDMTYYNSNSRVMEGEFSFPLGEGQTVSRFALDINGTLREGVVVEKEQGRKTFEAIVRRGVDPGLLEMTEGNNFRSRVYPLPAHGRRRLVIAFEQELVDKGTSDLYLLPINIKEQVASFSVHAEVVKNEVVFDKDNNELGTIAFKKWNDTFIADFEKDNYTPDKQIALSFPKINNEPKIFTASKNADTSYFYVNLKPEIHESIKILPKTITVLWDKSNSSKNRNSEKDFSILEAYIKKIGNVTIELVPFSLKTEKPQLYVIENGKCEKLIADLKAMIFDGATSFGCLDFTKFKTDEILLFSDGMSTFGKSDPIISNIPIQTINSSLVANHAFLTFISQKSGGVYININKLSNDEALSKLSNNAYQFISAKIENGKVFDVYPSMPCIFNGNFSIAGVTVGKSSSIILNFGFGNTIVYSKKIDITANNIADNVLLSRLWAEKKIAELSINEDKNKTEITKTGKAFGIVTRNTSLIVLETLQDYLRYSIVPPKEMQADYFSQLQTTKSNSKEKAKQHIESVVAMSVAQTKWWNTNYPIQVEKPVIDTKTTGQIQPNGNQTTSQVSPVSTTVTNIPRTANVRGQIIVTGTIIDGEFGGGLPGANVVLKGTNTGTTTDIDGKYSINVPNGNAIIEFSSIGFKSQSIKVGLKRVINLTLLLDNAQIEEVVKVGYGVQKKSDVTGSVGENFTVIEEAMAASPVANLDAESLNIRALKSNAEGQNAGTKADIQLNAWDPQTPYLKVLQYAQKGFEYQTYTKLKVEYGSTPSFYIDAADFFSKLGRIDTAVTILSNLAELTNESPQLLRILGQKLLELKQTSEAVLVFEKLLQLKGEEPQSYRDLGLAYESNGKHQQAIDTLYQVVTKEWDSRFSGIELIAMNDINAIIAANQNLKYSFIDKRLLKSEPVDIRVILMWDTDNCDMDLWVTDQTKEKCFYGNKLTQMGGKMSNDFTGGYGPEEYMIKKASSGDYIVQSNYYGTHSQALLAPVNLRMVFYTNFGKPNQKSQDIVIRLENNKDVIDVGSFRFKLN